jgi:hypothetical protein
MKYAVEMTSYKYQISRRSLGCSQVVGGIYIQTVR